jgi:hypothetical protein
VSVAEADEVSEVLNRIKNWTVEGRFALVRGVLDTLAPDRPDPSRTRRGRPVALIIESYKTDQPAPDDETIRLWIDEHRMGKYG